MREEIRTIIVENINEDATNAYEVADKIIELVNNQLKRGSKMGRDKLDFTDKELDFEEDNN